MTRLFRRGERVLFPGLMREGTVIGHGKFYYTKDPAYDTKRMAIALMDGNKGKIGEPQMLVIIDQQQQLWTDETSPFGPLKFRPENLVVAKNDPVIAAVRLLKERGHKVVGALDWI